MWGVISSRPGCTPLGRPGATGDAPTTRRSGAHCAGRKRSDVKRRARSISIPVTMAAAAAALSLTTTLQAVPSAQADEVAHAAGFVANQTWSQALPDAGNPVALSSPNVANLDGQPSVVVGDVAGKVYAYHLNGGGGVAGWPYNAGAPVQSSPSVAPISPNGTDSVFVGTGDAA